MVLPPTCHVTLGKSFHLNCTYLSAPSLGSEGVVRIRGATRRSVWGLTLALRGHMRSWLAPSHWRCLPASLHLQADTCQELPVTAQAEWWGLEPHCQWGGEQHAGSKSSFLTCTILFLWRELILLCDTEYHHGMIPAKESQALSTQQTWARGPSLDRPAFRASPCSWPPG